jgi:hypothetical protein
MAEPPTGIRGRKLILKKGIEKLTGQSQKDRWGRKYDGDEVCMDERQRERGFMSLEK